MDLENLSKHRTTLILTGIAAVLFGYIVLVERGSLSSGELEGRGTHVVQRFVRARVTRLELSHGDVHLVLTRDQTREEDMDTFDVGTWALEEPVEGAADVDSVDALLSAVEWLDARRELDGIDAEDITRFGLDEPRATLTFTVANESHTVKVGGDDPIGDGVYVQVDDAPHAYIVGDDFLEALTHDVEHFRSKELFPDFRTGDVRHVALEVADASAELEREGSRWWLRAPVAMMARGGTVDEMLRAVGDLRAERFLGEDPADIEGALGLDAPSRSIALAFAPWAEASVHAGEDRPELTLRVGAACPDHPSELVARVNEGPVVCVSAAALERLDQPTERYRELRMFTTPDDDIERVVVSAGDASFELARVERGWSLIRGERTTDADPGAIDEWLGELRASEATSFEGATDETIFAHRLGDDAALTFTLHRTDDGGTEVIQVGNSGPDGVWIRRGEEAQVALFPAAAADLLRAPSIRFRTRTIADRSREDLASITITRASDPDHDEQLHKEGSSWMLASPIEARADGAAVGDLVDALAPLSALRFVAPAASREHGLDRPRFVVHASFDAASADDEEEEEDEHDHGHEAAEEEASADDEEDDDASRPLDIALSIGADTEGGAFARLNDDPAVFVLPTALVTALAQPVASRDVLSVAASEIESISFRRGPTTHVLSRTESGWTFDGAAAPSEPNLAMLDRLAELRATGVERYDERPLRGAVLTMVITRRNDAGAVTLTFGAPEGEGDDAWLPATSDASPVVYRCSLGSVGAIIGYGL